MDDIPLNILDIVILVVLGLSALVGLIRGFVREVLSLGAWIGSAWLTLTFLPQSRVFVQNYIEDPLWSGIIGGVGSFLLIIVILMIIARLISKAVQASDLIGPLDRTLGIFFGLLRGCVLVVFGYILALTLVEEDAEKPEWAAASNLLPMVEQGANILLGVVPADIELPELAPAEEGDAEGKSDADTADEFGYTPDDDIGRLLEETLMDQLTPEEE